MIPVKKSIRLTVDAYTRVCLTLIAALLTLVVVGLWGEVSLSRAAEAQANGATQPFVNSAAQREEQIRSQERTVQRLEELAALLESGRVKVQIVEGAPAGAKTNVAPGK